MWQPKKYHDCVVSVFVNGRQWGSGVSVGSGKIVTNMHVVSEDALYNIPIRNLPIGQQSHQQKIEIRYKGKKYGAKVVRGNQQHDLCLLSVEGLDMPSLPLAPEATSLKPGDEVYAVGRPKGGLHAGKGKVMYLNEVSTNEPPLIIHNAPSKPGCSGSALINMRGELIGIQTFSNPAAVPVQFVRELLRRRDKKMISSADKPQTQIEHKHATILTGLAISPLAMKHLAGWVFAHPESYMAAHHFVGWGHGCKHQLKEFSAQDQQKLFAILESHTPSNCTRYQWLENIARCTCERTDLRVEFLEKTLGAASNPEEKKEAALELAKEYYDYRKDKEAALHYFEVARENLGNSFFTYFPYAAMASAYIEKGDLPKAQEVFFELMESKYHSVQNIHDTFDEYLEIDYFKGICTGEHAKNVLFESFKKYMRVKYPEPEGPQ